MSIKQQNRQPFEPYARLMNIIGDQLITDKKVAVIEIIKNSYDADAEKVSVRFFNLGNYGKSYLTEKEQPYIEIEDDGDGMTLNTIQNAWLRPATPNKLDKKKQKNNTTNRGRKIQGEKGIGRFAIHKLGEKIEVYTKTPFEDEIKVEMDFSEFDPEKADLFNQPPPNSDYKLLSEVYNYWYINNPPVEIKKTKGTLIRIYRLREKWSQYDLLELNKSIQRLISPIDENAKLLGIDFKQDFNIELFNNEKNLSSEEITTFKDIIERAPYTMFGKVTKEGNLDFTYKSTVPSRIFSKTINLLDKKELAAYNYVSYAIDRGFIKSNSKPSCGPFSFTFYAFDLSKPDRTILTGEIEKFIKDNFVFVLRDGVRVYPYGEKGIDWLNLDKLRSTFKAGQFISYNDLTGFVYISQEENPLLKDSTNRQGIMDIDGTLEDFKNLVTGVTEIFNTEIKIDKNKAEIKRNAAFKDSNEIVVKSFNSFKTSLEKIDNKEVLEKANSFLSTVQKHNEVMKGRMETVEDLAGLGMAVEKASHDALMLLSKMRGNIKDFQKKAKYHDYQNEELISLLGELDENLSFVYEEMQIIQPLFKNQRSAIKNISIFESIEKVIKYFRREIEGKINIKIIKDNDIIVKTNNGLILQILINILDNSIYWANRTDNHEKEIIFKLDTNKNTLLIADNGPGIREDITPVIFNEFFSLKSDGRGLGLYIVREILLRINGEIFVLQEEKDKVLPGANLLIKFNQH